MKILGILWRALAATAIVTASARAGAPAIEMAGDLFADLNPAGFNTGTGVWENSCGTCIGDFIADGAPVLATSTEGATGITLDGTNDFFTGPTAPAGLTGLDPTRSIEVWAFNPNIVGEETLVSWGNRGGPDGSNMSFNYGNHGAFGAVGHWGAPDIGWVDAGGAPAAGEWHHLVYTYDGTTTRVYSDGALMNSEVVGAGVINTHPNAPVRIGSQSEGADGAIPTPGLRGSLTVGAIRIHDGVLSDAQILNNFNAEVGSYPNPAPPPPAPYVSPIDAIAHRYSFNESSGTTLVDSVGGADGTIVDVGVNDATLGGGSLSLTGGAQADSDYADFPDSIVTQTAAAGDAGDLTIEVWGTENSVQNWSRVFSFGSATDNVLHMSWSRGTEVAQNELRFNQEGQVLGNLTLQDFGANVPGQESHWAVVFDDDGGSSGETRVSIYRDGELATSADTNLDIGSLGDADVWLGRSQWPDSGPNADYNEFRLYNGALNADGIRQSFAAGPESVVPEPSSVLILLVGLVILGLRRRS